MGQALARDSRELNCQVNDQLLSPSSPLAFLLTPSAEFRFPPWSLRTVLRRPGYAAVTTDDMRRGREKDAVSKMAAAAD